MDNEQILQILKDNPAKEIIKSGHEMNIRLIRCLTDNDIDGFFRRDSYFESEDIHKERKKTQSNKDLISRVLQKEQMIFSARGGSCFYEGISNKETEKLDNLFSQIRNNEPLRKWVENFAIKAFDVDPASVIFIERDVDGKPYPTYKSIQTIYDYKLKGNSCEYVCFHLTNKEAIEFGITDEDLPRLQKNLKSKYYRFIDETFDYIFKRDNDTFREVDGFTIKHLFSECPARVVSDVSLFSNNQIRLSKSDKVVEIFEAYMNDRSIRNLSKKYHGYPKAVRPLVTCRKCAGSGYVGDKLCDECNGTGFKQIRNVSDSIDIPLSLLAENTSLDIKKIFTYITPDIQTWNKQDESLQDLEKISYDTYWGTDNRKFSQEGTDLQETATKTLVNLQPVYARLEQTADWCEGIERWIMLIIGKSVYPALKDVMIKYGRDYILESTNELFEQYQEKKKNGSPEYILNDALDRYLRSLYMNNHIELSLALKMMEVEPFVHYTLRDMISMNIFSEEEIAMKKYFAEWYNLTSNEKLLITDKAKLKEDLKKYATDKGVIINTNN